MQMSPVLAIHICAGTVGLLSGGAAVSLRKGSRRHAVAGTVFVVSMLSLGDSAMYLAARKHQIGNFVGGMLTIYLVTTAWLTAQGTNRETSKLGWAATLVPVGVGLSILINGIQRATNPGGVPRWRSRRNELLPGHHGSTCRRGRRSPARARPFHHSTHCARSLAHVLCCSLPQDPYFWRGHSCSPSFYKQQTYFGFWACCR